MVETTLNGEFGQRAQLLSLAVLEKDFADTILEGQDHGLVESCNLDFQGIVRLLNDKSPKYFVNYGLRDDSILMLKQVPHVGYQLVRFDGNLQRESMICLDDENQRSMMTTLDNGYYSADFDKRIWKERISGDEKGIFMDFFKRNQDGYLAQGDSLTCYNEGPFRDCLVDFAKHRRVATREMLKLMEDKKFDELTRSFKRAQPIQPLASVKISREIGVFEPEAKHTDVPSNFRKSRTIFGGIEDSISGSMFDFILDGESKVIGVRAFFALLFCTTLSLVFLPFKIFLIPLVVFVTLTLLILYESGEIIVNNFFIRN